MKRGWWLRWIVWGGCLACSACTLVPGKVSPDQHFLPVSAKVSDVEDVSAKKASSTPPAATVSVLNQLQQRKVTVSVSKVPVAELLYLLAKDARLNLDVAADVEGEVTVNLHDQPLAAVLASIASNAGLRFSKTNGVIHVEKDTPYLESYRIDYPVLDRTTKGGVNIATSIATGGESAALQGNSSGTTLTSSSRNAFWQSLTESVQGILKEEARLVTVSRSVSTSSNESPPTSVSSKVSVDGQSTAIPANQEVALGEREVRVIASPEGGQLLVRATARQHQKVAEFLDRSLQHAVRQVLIEATIAEVLLGDEFQSGVDWSRLLGSGEGLAVSQQLIGNRLAGAPVTAITYQNTDSKLFSGQFSATIRLLESFGKTKVLSSPKMMVLNNQTALLKVVDEKVYFTVTLDESKNDKGDVTDRKFTSALHTVPVGVVMSVLPQISDQGDVILNIRPSISRITGYKQDPVPQLMNATFQNLVPEIQVREIESVLRIPDGQVVVLGGLMQDEWVTSRDGVPVLNRMPVIGDLFAYQSQKAVKSELIIFLRPVVMQAKQYQALLAAHHSLLPSPEFLSQAISAASLSVAGEAP